jgi:hypothetical protein
MELKLKKKKTEDKSRTGVQMPDWLHDLMRQVAKNAKVPIGAAFEDASLDWLVKMHSQSEKGRATMDVELRNNPEFRDGFTRRRGAERKRA